MIRIKARKYFQFILTFLIFTFTFLLEAKATVRYVSKTGSSTPPYTSWATASDSIQKCINICQSGDTVYVANGVYKEQIIMIPGLSLIGGGMDSCVIDTRDMSNKPDFYSITFGDSCLFKYFKVTVAYQPELYGLAAVCFNADALIEWNIFENSSDGIWLTNSNSIIKNCNFINIYTAFRINATNTNNDYKPIIENNYLSNLGGNAFQVVFDTEPVIRNNVVYLASDYAKGFVGGLTDSTLLLNNLFYSDLRPYTILGNSYNVKNIELNNILIADFQREAIWAGNDNIIKNNVIMNGEKAFTVPQDQFPIIQYNDIWNNRINSTGIVPDSTNISMNPMFENEDSLNFHLQMYSPLIDAGDPNILDRDGSRSDIGLYGGPYGEKYTYRDLAPKPPVNVTALYENKAVNLKWNKNTEADFSHYRIYRDTIPHFIYDTTKIVGTTSDTTFIDNLPVNLTEKNYYYLVTAFDSTNHQSAPSEEVLVVITGMTEVPPKVVEEYKLLNNYPNPFNASTKIPYRLKEPGYVKLYIYDVKGEVVRVLVNEWQDKGYYEVEFSPTEAERKRGQTGSEYWTGYNDDIASGIYLYQLLVRGEGDIPVFGGTGKMILLK